MIAVIFEFVPRSGARSTYLSLAAELASKLAGVDGFLSVERFQSITCPDKMLSLSFWRDEGAVARWRQLESHRGAQVAGREHVFASYRMRVAAAVRDYGLDDRAQAPADSVSMHR
jgi:heme-degrading monooxygenase HmoA